MKGFVKKSMAALGVTNGLLAMLGCSGYHNLVDPCYPERYRSMARQEVKAASDPQIANGHALDHTVWNYHFDQGTDHLTIGGQAHLRYVAQRRPAPTGTIFLQTAQDVSYDAADSKKFSESRAELDARRSQAVQKYLNAITAGRQLSFEVVVHDPPEAGMSAAGAGLAVTRMQQSYQGTLPSTAGAGAASSTGGGGAH